MSRGRLSPTGGPDSEAIRLVYIVTHPMTAKFLLRGQLSHLRKLGYEVHVLSAQHRYLDEVEQEEGVFCSAVPLHREIRPLTDLRALGAIFRALRKIRPDIVNASTPKAGVLGSFAAWAARVPVRVYTMRGLRLETVRGWQRPVVRAAERLAAATATVVACVSESLRAKYLEQALAKPERVLVVGRGSSNGVDTARFSPQPAESTAELRGSLGLTGDDRVIGFVGRLTRDKGIEDLASLFIDQVLPRIPGARLLLVGDFEPGDPVADSCKAALRRCPAVIMPGFVDDPAPYYRLMSVFAFPSAREGFPNGPLEAAASAVPTVAYRATGTLDAVVDGVTGRLVAPGNMAEFADALCVYLEKSDLLRRHGEQARIRVHNDFRNEVVWEAWHGLYRQSLAAGREASNHP